MTDTTDKTGDKGKTPVFDGEFDAERAQRLVENLRTDLDKARADLKTATDTLTTREDADKSEIQKATDRAAAAETALASVKTEQLRERIARKHALPDDLAEFLTGTTEEEIEKKATALAKFSVKAEPEEDGKDAELPGKPKTRLIPGHESDHGSTAFDPVAIAAEIRNRQ